MSTPAAAQKTTEIRLAHSPDSDDAFMFYALATGKVRLPGVKFEHILSDIESLNQAAKKEVYDVTAISFYAYPFVADKYVLMDCGASFGEGYGPIVVSGHPIKKNELAGRKIAIPGMLTTSYLALKLFEPNVETVTMPFDKILDAVQNKEVEAGLLIHEGQLLFLADGPASRGGPGPMVAGTNRIAAAAGRERDSPEAGRGFGAAGIARDSRKRFVRAGSSRTGAELRAAICARHGSDAGRQVCGNVRQPLDAGLRRRRTPGRARIAGARSRGGPASRRCAGGISEQHGERNAFTIRLTLKNSNCSAVCRRRCASGARRNAAALPARHLQVKLLNP